MSELRLYIVRHGEPAYPEDALTTHGRRQARALARHLSRLNLTAVYSSPLHRARQTALYTAEATGLPCTVEPWMSELESWAIAQEPWGEAPAWEVDPPIVRDADPPLQRGNWSALAPWEGLDLTARFAALALQSDAFLARHGWVREGGRYRSEDTAAHHLAVFCHAGFALTWLSHLLEIPPPFVWAGFSLAPATITEVAFAPVSGGGAVPRCVALGAAILGSRR